MNNRKFEITMIPFHIKTLSNFQKWVNIGQLEAALLVGLIEYHFKINKVEIINSKLLDEINSNSSMVKIKTLLNNFKNKPSGFQSFLEQIKIQDPYGKFFMDIIFPYFKQNYKTSPQQQIKFLQETYQVQYKIIEDTQKQQENLYNNENNTIILCKYEENYYLILNQQIRKIPMECTSCENKMNNILLACSHYLCFSCIQKEFQASKLLESFTCPYLGCKQNLNKQFYQTLQKQQQNAICNQQQSQIKHIQSPQLKSDQKLQIKEEQNFNNMNTSCKQCNSIKSTDSKQFCKSCDESIKIKEITASQIENMKIQNNTDIIQNGIQQNQIQQNQQPQAFNSNIKSTIIQEENLKISEKKMENNKQVIQQCTELTFNSNLQNEERKQKIQSQTQEIVLKCVKCKKLQGQKNIIQISCPHNYCINCAQQLCQNENQFMCQECGVYVQTSVVQLAIQSIFEKQDQKCCKCKLLFNVSFLLQNKCFHFICAPCLEELVQKKQTYLRCPNCSKGISVNDANLFFDKIFNLKLEQTKEQEEQSEQQQVIQTGKNNEQNQQIQIQINKQENEQINKKKESKIRIIQLIEQENLIQLEEPLNCSFCFSPFTDYNARQFLTYCQNSRHFIGVCCIIFPSDCPQCQMGSLNIEKGNLRFQLPCIKNDDTVKNINQYI